MVFQKGDSGKPAIVFIHGLGMDEKIWENPSESRVLGGSLPINILLSKRPMKKDFGYSRKKHFIPFPGITTGIRPRRLKTLFDDMRLKGYTVITWTQKRPIGPVALAVSELKEIIDFADKYSKKGIILVGHSRGGLIARKYLRSKDKRVKGLITICTPHRGSAITKLAVYISPLTSIISPLFPYSNNRGVFRKFIKRIIDFLESEAIRELLPDSDFFKSLNDKKVEGVYYMTIGGTSPLLLTMYRWKWQGIKEGLDKRWILSPERILSIPDIFEKVIPKKLYFAELKKGMGDGLVTAESSRIQWCDNHYNFPLNHAAVLFDKSVRRIVSKAIDNNIW